MNWQTKQDFIALVEKSELDDLDYMENLIWAKKKRLIDNE